jgi:hypothetical protein
MTWHLTSFFPPQMDSYSVLCFLRLGGGEELATKAITLGYMLD